VQHRDGEAEGGLRDQDGEHDEVGDAGGGAEGDAADEEDDQAAEAEDRRAVPMVSTVSSAVRFETKARHCDGKGSGMRWPTKSVRTPA